ncbi:MAG: nucleoside triphosphate pyrophosphohydrolase [Parcubacteria bacterium OLB19]|nr:MAG: nucleoside triphosphate pyrophosphohydrolase [Parcubacteria bacterium OLB19]
MQKEFVIRCRAIIIHDSKLLTVRHVGKSFLALPGGHLEFGEDPKECVYREVIEELGIAPKIGKVLFVNTFKDGENKQPVEFFFEILNSSDYLDLEKTNRTHVHEIEEYVWVSPDSDSKILPEKFGTAFKDGNIDFNQTCFIKD